MNKTFNRPPSGNNRLRAWVKALLIVLVVSSAIWVVLCIIAVAWMGGETMSYDASAKPAQEVPTQP